MSNLLKGGSVHISDGAHKVIDSNRLMETMLAREEQRKSFNPVNPNREADADGFVSGLDVSVVDQLLADSEEEQEPMQEMGPDPALLEQANQILEDAQAEAERILKEAEAEAHRLQQEAKNQGYEEGLSQGMAAADTQIANKERELETSYRERCEALELETANLRANMESQLTEVLMNVYSRAILAISEDKKDIIFYLADKVLRNAELSRDFMIRVSEEDYKFLENNKQKLYGADNPDIRIDIVKDLSMTRNQCVIETDTGVFDASLDIQLDNLRESIHLLSCMQE